MLLALLLLAASSQPPKTLAALEFRSKLPKGDVDVGYLTDVVRTAAKDAVPNLKVMTRENMLVLLQATGKKMEECEGECEVDTGRRVGADLVISGEVLKFGTQFKVNMRLHDTHSGELLSGAQATGKDLDELDRNLNAAVTKLLVPIRDAPQAQPQTQLQAAPPPRSEPPKRVAETARPAPEMQAGPAQGHSPLGFGAFALLGYFTYAVEATNTATGASAKDDTSGLGYGASGHAEWRISDSAGLGLFAEYAVLQFKSTTSGTTTTDTGSAFDIGPMFRYRFGSSAFYAALTYDTLSDNAGSGAGLFVGLDIGIAGPLALRLELAGRAPSTSFSGVDLKSTVGTGFVGAGVAF